MPILQPNTIKKLTLIKMVVGVVAFLSIVLFLVHQIKGGHLDHFNPEPWLIVKLCFLLPPVIAFKIVAWHHLMKRLGAPLPLHQTSLAYIYSIAGKYIPGKVFFVVGRVSAYGPDKKRIGLASLGMIIEFSLEILAGCILFVVAISLGTPPIPWKYPLLITGACIALIMSNPHCINALTCFLMRKRGTTAPPVQLRYRDVITTVSLILMSWAFMLVCIKLLCHDIYHFRTLELPYVGGSLSLSSLAGTLAMISPGGLGVREGFFTEFLQNFQSITLEMGLVLAALARILQWGAEILVTALFFVFRLLVRSGTNRSDKL